MGQDGGAAAVRDAAAGLALCGGLDVEPRHSELLDYHVSLGLMH